MQALRRISLLFGLLGLLSCKDSPSKTTLWIYTSSYKDTVAWYREALQSAFPDLQIEWFQSGSENISAKIQAELASGHPQADLLMTADLFSYLELQKQDALLSLKDLPEAELLKKQNILNPEGNILVNRFPVMVIGYQEKTLKQSELPTHWKDLLKPQYKGRLTMPSPMESGSALTSILFFKALYGETYFEGLRKNEMLAAGGNGATLARIQTGERPLGIILMENVLQAQSRGLPIKFIIPEEGALPIPSALAALKSTRYPQEALKVLHWILTSPQSHEILKKSWAYSALSPELTPAGAPKWSSLHRKDWSFKEFNEWRKSRNLVKQHFQETVLR